MPAATGQPIWHITLISFRKETSDRLREEIQTHLRGLANYCGGHKAGILFWQVGKNLDPRKEVHLVVISVFDSLDALEKYKSHPAHIRLTNVLRRAADWQVGDIERWEQKKNITGFREG